MNKNEKLNNVLEKGETIRWVGAPRPYGLFDESRRGSTIMTICWALAWAVVSIWGYHAMTASSGAEIKTGVVIFLAGVSLMIVLMPVMDKRKVQKLLYAITDKKVNIISEENDNPISIPLADIDDIRVDKGDKGNCHVRVGSAVFKASVKKLPGLAFRGEFVSRDDGKKTYKGLVFFNVSAEDGKTIGKLLKPAS
ncbi:MAG: hypothetical protein LBU64_03515 [Planctomycetota bacterium]|jgi:hypothetical protein|nr:hypothetical protein [Planctomycetota bacterium]